MCVNANLKHKYLSTSNIHLLVYVFDSNYRILTADRTALWLQCCMATLWAHTLKLFMTVLVRHSYTHLLSEEGSKSGLIFFIYL